MEKRTIASEAFSYGKRSFFLDFMVARTGSNYIQITKRDRADDGSFTTRRLAIFMDDFEWLISGFSSLLHSAVHAGDKECSVHDLLSQSKTEKSSSGIKGWDPASRPRERLAELGSGALEAKELIALLIGSGCRDLSAVELAEKMLCSVGGDLGKLSEMSFLNYLLLRVWEWQSAARYFPPLNSHAEFILLCQNLHFKKAEGQLV